MEKEGKNENKHIDLLLQNILGHTKEAPQIEAELPVIEILLERKKK